MRATDLRSRGDAGVTRITILAHEGLMRDRRRGFAVQTRAVRAARFEAFEVVGDEHFGRFREDMTLSAARVVAHAGRLRMRVRRSNSERRTFAAFRSMARNAFARLRRMSNHRRSPVIEPPRRARLPRSRLCSSASVGVITSGQQDGQRQCEDCGSHDVGCCSEFVRGLGVE